MARIFSYCLGSNSELLRPCVSSAQSHCFFRPCFSTEEIAVLAVAARPGAISLVTTGGPRILANTSSWLDSWGRRGQRCDTGGLFSRVRPLGRCFCEWLFPSPLVAGPARTAPHCGARQPGPTVGPGPDRPGPASHMRGQQPQG